MTTIQQYLGVPKNWPINEDVKHAIILMPTKEDIKKGDPKDPMGCALHNAACRMFNIPNCAIGGRRAYIPQKDEKGNWYIARMRALPRTQAAIKKFDRTGVMPEGGFKFQPLAPSDKFKYKRKYMRLWYKGRVGKDGTNRHWSKHRRNVRCLPMAIRNIA